MEAISPRGTPALARLAPHARSRAGASPLVPALSRALTLLDRLAVEREPMSLARLASDLELPKSSVHGLCSTLVSFGYLRRQADGAFRIGPRVMGLAEAFVSGTDVAQEFNALWADIGAAPEETVVLSVLSGTDALYVAVRNSARPLGLAFTVGMRLPAYLSGSGKAMLAFVPVPELRRRFAGGLGARLTKKGPRSVDALLKDLAATKKRGYSIDDEAVREGVYSFGRAGVRRFGRSGGGRCRCASTRRCSAPTAACAIATPRSPSRQRSPNASVATWREPGRRVP